MKRQSEQDASEERLHKVLTAAECAEWHRELAVREEALQERERASKTASHDLSILESSITIKQRQLDTLRDDYTAVEKEQAVKNQEYERERDVIRYAVDRAKARLPIVNGKYEDVLASVTSARCTLREIEREATDRKVYLREQEKIIATIIEEGNLSFRALELEIGGLEDTKAGVAKEIYDLGNDKSNIIDEITDLHEALSGLEDQHATKLQEIEDRTGAQEKLFVIAKRRLDNVTKSTEAKLQVLHVKEQSLLTKQAALRRSKLELDQDKRRWSGTKSLYNVN